MCWPMSFLYLLAFSALTSTNPILEFTTVLLARASDDTLLM
jgi:hypothetical protein